jgi:UDP-N-acetylmuramate--alanine ligase
VDRVSPELAALGRVHLVGVGGAGVSVVARLLAARGVPVQGSDAADGPALAALRADGLTVWVGHDAAHVVGPDGAALVDTLVVSSAVRATNPELAAARAAGITVLHRSEALARLMAGTRAVAVAGAHGKTTTSAMVATVLGAAGLDASYAIGGTVRVRDGEQVVALPGGHAGTADVLVAEADESDGSFLNYAPTVAVVTNVEADHLDHYGTQEAFEQAFADFAGRIVPGGHLVACADDPGSARLAQRHRAAGGSVVTYGTAPGADVVVRDVEVGPGTVRAVVAGGPLGDDEHVLALELPGRHNALNATAAVVTAVLLGVGPQAAVTGAHEFVGTGRRFEPKGEVGGVRVFDSYDHHPTEVDALLRAARPVAGEGRLLVLFQPHLYSRTRAFADRFADALALADEVVVTGVYRAREDVDPTVDARTITDRRERTGTGGLLRPVEDRLEAAHLVAALAQPGDVLITVGAGDVTELGPVVLADLATRFGVADPAARPPGATMG